MNNHIMSNISTMAQHIAKLSARVAHVESIANISYADILKAIENDLSDIEKQLIVSDKEEDKDATIGNVIGTKNVEGSIAYQVDDIWKIMNGIKPTFKEIFTSKTITKFDRDYIPEVDTEKSANEPYYFVGSDGVCEIGNIDVNSDETYNYNQRICVLKNICKLYDKYKFANATFTNADLSYLFADNKYLTSITYDKNTKFIGNTNFKGYLQNCVSTTDLMSNIDNITAKVVKNDNNEMSLIFDDFFKGCYQFENINSSIKLNFELPTLTNISLVNTFEPIKNITSNDTPIKMNAMFDDDTLLSFVNLSNMFPNLLSIYSSDAASINIDVQSMFNKCKNLKTINMDNIFGNLIRITTDTSKQIACNNMFNGVLSSSNPDLIFSYSGYIFSNALGYCNPQKKDGAELFGIKITRQEEITQDEKEGTNTNYIYKLYKNVIGFPLAVAYNSEKKQDWPVEADNGYVGYDGNARKLITWKYVADTSKNVVEHIEQITEIMDN